MASGRGAVTLQQQDSSDVAIHGQHAPCKPAPAEPTLGEFHDQCGGMFQIAIFDAAEFIDCAAAAELGSPLTLAYMQAICEFKKRINELRRPICLCCDYVFFPKRPPAAVAVGMPFTASTAVTVIVSGVCGACMTKGPNIVMARALEHGKTI